MKRPISDDNLEYILKAFKREFGDEISAQIQSMAEALANSNVGRIHDEIVLENQSFEESSLVYNIYENYKNYVIVSAEVLIKSKVDETELKVIEQGLEVLVETLEENEVQKYILSTTQKQQIYGKGEFDIYLYIDYLGSQETPTP